MTYRILVDENTSPVAVKLLRDAGHDALHVTETLEEGVPDVEITRYATEHDCLVLTHDTDFLRPAVADGISILYYSDDSLGSETLASRVEELYSYIPDQADLPPITNLGE